MSQTPDLLGFSEPEKGTKLLIQLIEKSKHAKLSLRDVLDIEQENVNTIVPKTVQDLPLALLRKLMALDRTAWNTQLVSTSQNSGADLGPGVYSSPQTLYAYLDFDSINDQLNLINPSDILCTLLLCSDHFLKQIIFSKMSMCQFALPLLLPADNGLGCTFMLWAMRDIVKRWRPQSLMDKKGYIEENLVRVPTAFFSFVRLGPSKLSKSKILNLLLSPAQQYHDFFIHENMEGGNIKRTISNGILEMSWYFPFVGENSDTFPEPIAVANLRGDLESNWTQFSFLTKVSSAVFIFADSINEDQYQLLSGCCQSDTTFYFIITPGAKNVSKETVESLQNLFSKMKIDVRNIIRKDRGANDAELVKKIQNIITNFLNNSCRKVKLENLSHAATELGIKVDEFYEECQEAKNLAKEITEKIKNVVQYKRETMKLQGELWKEVTQTEKELCRMKNQGDVNIEEYKSQLSKHLKKLHMKQNQHSLPNGMIQFIFSITGLFQTQRHYFLKWMKCFLDSVARKNLSELQNEYKEKCKSKANNQNELKQLDQQISNSSLGIEHFIRELGQFYEAECSMVKQKQIHPDRRQFSKLPGIAAGLLLDGFPLELIDGDASNIPLQWVTDVLMELDNKTGGRCRMRVITVLGVQSTGKSTLLNTMFGLQFPVASGRCTRGAFMTLIKVKENFQKKLKCEFILVIDTEGLKAPELASLEDSYEHDNELATLVVGLSDITIVNTAMEHTAEMRDILQIVVHAFLRMKEIGKKPNCQFVHQNVNDVSAHQLNMRDRRKLLEQLNEMTRVAANMEKRSRITCFSDIMDYNLETDNWYIPGLWYGVPPMASANTGYSENVYQLKKYLFEFLGKENMNPPQSISAFIEWIKSLWNSVKHENFIFSFRNSLVAEAYDQLSVKYSQWEWNFRKHVHTWLINMENKIKNQLAEKLLSEMCTCLKDDLANILMEQEKNMVQSLEKYFESKCDNVHMIERFREDFFRGVKFLRTDIERSVTAKIDEAIRIQKGKYHVKEIQSNYQAKIEKQVTSLLETVRRKDYKLGDKEVKDTFEEMWKKTLAKLPNNQIQKHSIHLEILQELKRDIANRGSMVNERFLSVKSLDEFGKSKFIINDKYIDIKWFSMKGFAERWTSDYHDKIQTVTTSIIQQCYDYVTKKINTSEDYDRTYCQELLNIINKRLWDKKDLHITYLCELDLKLHILGSAAPRFQKMHENFIQENDPTLCLEKLKPDYLATFENLFHEKDKTRNRAEHFCELCLKPAITDHINQHLGKDIVDEILRSGESREYCSRTFFQFTVLNKLLEEETFTEYVEYIKSYERFVKTWIRNYIFVLYQDSKGLEDLQIKILSHICANVRKLLKDSELLNSPTVSDFLKSFCTKLESKLVISQNDLKVIIFQNTANVEQFSNNIEKFLSNTEKQIKSEITFSRIESVLPKLSLKPEDELFKRVFGCGKQCPFCKVPCEAGGTDHKEHFASVHRPQGLKGFKHESSRKLVTEICSTAVVGGGSFRNGDTERKWHPYKEYRTLYPDWAIQPDPSITASDYWKYIFTKFNKLFAEKYKVKTADLPDTWLHITKEQALQSLKETFNMK